MCPSPPRYREATHGRVSHNDEARTLGLGIEHHDLAAPTAKQARSALHQAPEAPVVDANTKLATDWNPGVGIEASNRAHFLGDARIRNPVPIKLQHKLNDKDGNFGVMHMDVRKPVLDSRDLAAKRTSELTQAAAIQATRNGYQSIKRSKLAWHPLAPAPRPDQRLHDVLTPEAVKTEQGRLLTLVRSLHPTLVVDQLCRALAYFGGAPGTLPSTELTFPESDRMNGSGKSFVGWLAEIFPPMDLENLPQPSWIAMPVQETTPSGAIGEADQAKPDVTEPSSRSLEHASSNGMTITQKRPRGRPKGSKSTKTRKDKGFKKGERVPTDGSAEGEGEAPPFQTSQLSQPSQPIVDAQNSGSTHPGGIEHESSPTTAKSGKKRGRPKGSKNRPKPFGAEDGTSQSLSSAAPPTAISTTNVTADTPTKDTSTSIRQSPQSQSQGPNQSDSSTGGNSGMQVAALSQRAQIWAGQPSRAYPQPSQSTDPTVGHSPGRKRKPSMQLNHISSSALSEFQTPENYRSLSVSPTLRRNDRNTAQWEAESVKRRRISRETGQLMAQVSKDTHPNPSSVAASTASSTGMVHDSPQGHGSQSPSNTQPAMQQANVAQMRRGPWNQQQQQQQYLQMQQQHQKRAQQMARNAVSLDVRDEALGGSTHSRPPRSFLSSSQDQQRAAAALTQRNAHSQQMQQQKPGSDQSPPSLPYATEHGAGIYQPQLGSGAQSYSQASPTGRAQSGQAPGPSAMGLTPTAYPGFAGDPGYLGMQYALGASRAAQSGTDACGAQLGENQLEATLARADMPDRMYSTFERQT